uniref:Homeobox domain-containing protein n=1 Tax=Globodera rostochiensis TaxID=31243 RepID=A0A914HNR4_GLORO
MEEQSTAFFMNSQNISSPLSGNINREQLKLLIQIHGTGIGGRELINAFAELEQQMGGGTDYRKTERRRDENDAEEDAEQHENSNGTAILLLHQLAVAQRQQLEHVEQRSAEEPEEVAETTDGEGRAIGNKFETEFNRHATEQPPPNERNGRIRKNGPLNTAGTEPPLTMGSNASWSPKPRLERDSLPPIVPTACSSSSAPSSSSRPIRSQRTPMKEIITLDDPGELDEFMARGEEQCIHAMRAFITQFSLRQTTVATMTGVSQPYISKLLNGNHRELSLRCRKNIYCWYLNCRRHPEKLAMFMQDPCTRLETTAEGELIPQRRERYVFRPVLLRVLEAYFQESAFPDIAKRVEIANACNAHLQIDKRGAQLMPKEVVTPQVIANWFANKRKEMRRRTGGIAPELGVAQRNRLNSLSGGHRPTEPTVSGLSNSPSSSPNSTVLSYNVHIEQHQKQQHLGSSMEEVLLVHRQNQQQQIVERSVPNGDQPVSSAQSVADLALLLPTFAPSRQPNCTPIPTPSFPQSLLQLPPPVDHIHQLVRAQPSLANQFLLLHQLLIGTLPAEGGCFKQDQQHLLMAHEQ